MSWTDWTLFGVFVLGFILFLYGANTYDATVGYAGIFLFIGSIFAYLVIYILKQLTEKPVPNQTQPASPAVPDQKP